jgi:histidine triad (HIT) family protein
VRADESCIFCQIVAGHAPAHRVAEDELALAFMDIFPASPGHALVIPRAHAANVFEIDADSMRAVAALARRLALAQRAELAPDGLAVYQANGAAAGQTVWHYHVHLIPRTTGQGMIFHGRARADDGALARQAGALAERLAGIP